LEFETTGNGTSIAAADGPDSFSEELPTIMGVGVTRGRIWAGLTAGIEFVTTTSTGVGVGSADDCENAASEVKESNKATQKNFVHIIG
jgi:hypothetical protein